MTSNVSVIEQGTIGAVLVPPQMFRSPAAPPGQAPNIDVCRSRGIAPTIPQRSDMSKQRVQS